MFKSRILSTDTVTHDVKRFVIEKPEGYYFFPGQAADVSINKPGWENEKRPFTITSRPNDEFLEFVIKSYPLNQGVTKLLHSLSKGDELLITEPFGTISYKGSGLFLAGGTGITPFLSIFRSHPNSSSNTVIFSNKTSKDIIYEQELRDLLENRIIFTLTEENNPSYLYGNIRREMIIPYLSSDYFYICGPISFTVEMKKMLDDLRINPEKVILEI